MGSSWYFSAWARFLLDGSVWGSFFYEGIEYRIYTGLFVAVFWGFSFSYLETLDLTLFSSPPSITFLPTLTIAFLSHTRLSIPSTHKNFVFQPPSWALEVPGTLKTTICRCGHSSLYTEQVTSTCPMCQRHNPANIYKQDQNES